MNAKLAKLKRKLERAGGKVMISPDMPDDLAEAFMKAIADCPECAAAIAATAKKGPSRHEH